MAFLNSNKRDWTLIEEGSVRRRTAMDSFYRHRTEGESGEQGIAVEIVGQSWRRNSLQCGAFCKGAKLMRRYKRSLNQS